MAIQTDEERLALFRRFIDRFRPQAPSSVPPPQPVQPREIADVEKALEAFFPASLTQFWLAHGCGPMPGVAATGAIFPRPADAPPPLQRLLSPAEVARQIRTPRFAPIPGWIYYEEEDCRGDIDRDDAWKYILPIAADARGRWICLMRHYNIENDLPVYHFDHRAGSIAEIAPGFDDLLQAYLRLPGAR